MINLLLSANGKNAKVGDNNGSASHHLEYIFDS